MPHWAGRHANHIRRTSLRSPRGRLARRDKAQLRLRGQLDHSRLRRCIVVGIFGASRGLPPLRVVGSGHSHGLFLQS